MLDLEQVVRRDERTASRILAGEAVVLTPLDGRIYNLNPTGTRLWEWLTDEITIAALADRLQGEFQVTPEQARADVAAFIEVMLNRGLVSLGPAPAGEQ
jgi:hypothetical protein